MRPNHLLISLDPCQNFVFVIVKIGKGVMQLGFIDLGEFGENFQRIQAEPAIFHNRLQGVRVPAISGRPPQMPRILTMCGCSVVMTALFVRTIMPS